jgi:uracil phosphoribosyltransferase
MQRNEETHQPESYYDKLPRDISGRRVYVLDPMLATGGSASAAVEYLREAGVAGTIRFLCIVAAPEGIERLLKVDDDLIIYTCAIDEGLNDAAYIVPGLGDAGDRIFGTE